MPLIFNIPVDPTTGLPTSSTGTTSSGYITTAAGGASTAKVASAATTNATSVKASPGRVVGFVLCNTTAAFKFFRLYNKASAPTVGTDSPAVIIGLPPNSTITRSLEGGAAYSLGIAYSITNLVGDLDATAVAANDVIGAVYYA